MFNQIPRHCNPLVKTKDQYIQKNNLTLKINYKLSKKLLNLVSVKIQKLKQNNTPTHKLLSLKQDLVP